jgi:hypothetical protein
VLTWENSRKSLGRSSGARPAPVSATAISSQPGSGWEARTVTLPPSGVNFTALLTRLKRICFSRTGSAVRGGRSAGASRVRVTFFVCAVGRTMVSASSSMSPRGRLTGSRTIFPASTFERSRMSVMMARRCFPLVWMCPM